MASDCGRAGRRTSGCSTPTNSSQFTAGHVDLAALLLRRVPDGQMRQEPSCTACRATENAPEITAWDAMTVATSPARPSGSAPSSAPAGRTGWRRQPGRLQDQRALAEVVQRQRGEHHREPGPADRRAAEVAHVRVQRLGTGDRQHDRAHRDERQVHGWSTTNDDRVRRRAGARRMPGGRRCAAGPSTADHHEPQQHHRPEQPAHPVRAQALRQEQHDQDRHADRQHRPRGRPGTPRRCPRPRTAPRWRA